MTARDPFYWCSLCGVRISILTARRHFNKDHEGRSPTGMLTNKPPQGAPCEDCGRIGCDRNFHRSIAQIIEEAAFDLSRKSWE